jgi:hypothetical protein
MLTGTRISSSGTDRLPTIATRVGLIIEAPLRHGSTESGEAGSNPAGGKADHHEMVFPAATYPICQSLPESNSDGDREVYMVGQGGQPTEKITEEIA